MFNNFFKSIGLDTIINQTFKNEEAKNEIEDEDNYPNQ